MSTQTLHDVAVQAASAEQPAIDPSPDAIAALAYQLWILRARPIGSPEVDWLRAEEELRNSLRYEVRAA